MKLLAVFSALLSLIVTSAFATPPDLVCIGGSADDQVEFEIPLITGHSSIYPSGVAPMAAHHVRLQYWEDLKRTDVEIYGDQMVAQWLLDGRVDLRFYVEEQNEQGEITSYDLIVRTKATGQMSLESGHRVHFGQYVFRAYSGSLSEGNRSIFIERTGQVDCK